MALFATALASIAAAMAVYAANELGAGRMIKGGAERGGWRSSLVRALISLGGVIQRLLDWGSFHGQMDLKGRIRRAGFSGRIEPRDLFALKLAAAALSLMVGLAFNALQSSGLFLLLALVGPPASFFAPDAYLARVASLREQRVVNELPYFLDLLRVTVDAGLSVQRGLALTAGYLGGPLGHECRRVVRERQLGAGRRDSLGGLAERIAVPEMEAFVAAVHRSEQHGVPLADTLARQARSVREERRRRVQQRAARAGPKIQLVVAAILVPAVLLLFAAALVGRILGGAGGSTLFG